MPGSAGYQKVMILKKVIVPKEKNHNSLHWLPKSYDSKNKMEPTNPNANTIEKLKCPKDTLVGHSCGTLCRTLLWATLVGNSCGTLL